MQLMLAAEIYATCNHPRWSGKTLRGLSVQSYCDFEIIATADGSGDDTGNVIERLANMDIKRGQLRFRCKCIELDSGPERLAGAY